MKKIFLITMLTLILTTPYLAAAQSTTTTNPCTVSAVQGSSNKLTALPQCINQVYKWSLGIGALLALLMTVIGGYYYMTSAGNAEQASKGTEMIWGAIIGLVLLFGAYLLLNTINPDFVNLKVG
ncbi:MAG TPA: hypothetical protein VL306_03115, partial [Methylomirabilota bacterium]|nr:hypothetical protein [Methylomirabilota bacterium]